MNQNSNVEYMNVSPEAFELARYNKRGTITNSKIFGEKFANRALTEASRPARNESNAYYFSVTKAITKTILFTTTIQLTEKFNQRIIF